MIYSILRRYSALTDGRVARISMADRNGGEFFMTIADDSGPRAFRQRRDEAVTAICEAIGLGIEPGEVRIV